MSEAGQQFIDLPRFHDRVGEELAHLTRNEAACVSSGAAAGVLIAVAACIAGDDIKRAQRLPDPSAVLKSDVVVWRDHVEGILAGADETLYNGYLSAVAMAGGTLRAISYPEELGPDTACLLWFPKIYPKIVEEERWYDRFHERATSLGIPIIVDAADQVPPVSNLWHYTEEKGAALAIFSGGKGLCGPGSSGLVVGRKDLIRACRANSGPEHSVGRPAKVGKEELAGLLQAVREAVTSDPAEELAHRVDVVERWIFHFRELERLGVEVQMKPTSHSGQPIPRALLTLPVKDVQLRNRIIDRLWNHAPSIALLPDENFSLALNPHMVRDEQIDLVSRAVVDVITRELDSARAMQTP
jgi:L-seryl-tRNA(Ser) seleniumtransferase